MKIKIAARLAPFSHTPGSGCLIPGTTLELRAFPTKLTIPQAGIEHKCQVTGPVQNFTLQQDLEKNCVWIFGKGEEGFFRIKVEATDEGFNIGAEHIPYEMQFVKKTHIERLSLGGHKLQNWDYPQELEDSLPVLFLLGQKIPHIEPFALKGTASLLQMPTDRNKIASALDALLKAGFSKILVPRLFDDQYQGLSPEETIDGNPSILVQEGAKIIRSLFFKQNERRLAFLPTLAPRFHSGRMVSLMADGIGEIDFEWSKGLLKKAIFRVKTAGDVVLELQKEIKTFRVRKNLKEKGKTQCAKEPLVLSAGSTYFLDRFKK